jgi:hypothetical protein
MSKEFVSCRAIHSLPRELTLNKGPILYVALSAVFLACGGVEVTSTFRDRTIVIDGDGKEWAGMTMRTEKNISFAVCNDSTYLYLLLSTTDHGLQRQIFARGLNIWFDATGGSDKTFGIHFPLGMKPGQRMRPLDGQGEPTGDQEEPPRMGEGAVHEMEILGPGADDKMIVSLVQEKDIQLKMSNDHGILVYELRVPLVRDRSHPNGIGGSLAGPVGVGLETPKFDMAAIRERMGEQGMQPPGERGGEMPQGEGGGRSGGGMGRGHGGGGGRGGRGGERAGNSAPEAISLWAKVTPAAR